MPILQDPIWQFFGVIVGIIALIISVIMPVWLKNRKELSYQILSEVENRKLPRTKPISILRLMNSGNEPIALSDFHAPIKIVFRPEVDILAATVEEPDPYDLPVEIEATNSTAFVAPLMLNPQDSFNIVFELSSFSMPHLEGRIEGIRQIRKRLIVKNTLIIVFIITALINGITLYLAMTESLQRNSPEWWIETIVGGFSRLVSIGVTIPIIVDSWKDFQRRERMSQ
jgi:hypothetical protein